MITYKEKNYRLEIFPIMIPLCITAIVTAIFFPSRANPLPNYVIYRCLTWRDFRDCPEGHLSEPSGPGFSSVQYYNYFLIFIYLKSVDILVSNKAVSTEKSVKLKL